jgi:glycosyltransferase involved in cell wall biosynthesis
MDPPPRLDPAGSELAPASKEGVSTVAIVMRTKDRPLLLARGLASVLSQTFSRWTLWLVNDGGSAERLEDVLASFRGRFGDRLRVIHNDTSLGM